MVDPIAVWGAVTGTVGLGIAGWRELRGNKRSLRVERGWQFVYDADEQLQDVWVCVMVWNTGRRPLHVEYVGFEALVVGERKIADDAGMDLPPENNVWVNKRFEIALNGDTLEVVPDGPSVKVWTRLFPICADGIDPTGTEVQPYVVTVPEKWWLGPPGPLLPELPPGKTLEEAGTELVSAAVKYAGPEVLAANPANRPGEVIGVMRLILEGDVERTSDLFPDQRLPGSDAAGT